MSNVATGLPAFPVAYTARYEAFVERLRGGPGVVLGTLGPAGTSSHDAALFMQQAVAAAGVTSAPELRLYQRFDDLLERVCTGRVDYALVPSAYHNATAFHWHPDLELAFHFARATPDYGLAVGDAPLETPELSVATMREVRVIFEQLLPERLSAKDIVWVDARSTHHAAEVVAEGAAHLALTNDSNRRTFGLRWLTSRPGAEIVWLVFEQADRNPEPHPRNGR